MEQFLTAGERSALLSAAREAIESRLQAAEPAGAEARVVGGNLKKKCGAFVTLTRQGRLRGCIGFVVAERPLLETVREAARAAAFQDPRFPPLRAQELPEIRLEISVLSEPGPVQSLEQIRVGTHGLIVRRGARSGLLLPQVATEYGWDRDTFLSHACAKAGLPGDCWREPGTEIEIFSAEVFGEEGA
jgi:AmmeMemoRadiSam system protein A